MLKKYRVVSGCCPGYTRNFQYNEIVTASDVDDIDRRVKEGWLKEVTEEAEDSAAAQCATSESTEQPVEPVPSSAAQPAETTVVPEPEIQPEATATPSAEGSEGATEKPVEPAVAGDAQPVETKAPAEVPVPEKQPAASVTPAATQTTPIESMTKTQLMDALTEKGIGFKGSSSKDQLIELLKAAQ